MAAQKPSVPKGTRDFSPIEMVKRNFIFDTIKDVFKRYGFLPIETPSMENLSTLLGKYGDEGDKLLFKILDSGNFFNELNDVIEFSFTQFSGFIYSLDKKNYKSWEDEFSQRLKLSPYIELLVKEYISKNKNKIFKSLNEKGIEDVIKNRKIPFEKFSLGFFKRNPNIASLMICEKGLRYDLTVPFARYVVQHLNEITFPFKRYQIQPVWRADRPQKGRYREFYQCDVDVIGSNSLLNEVELIQIIDQVFQNLNVNAVIKINNRKILAGIAETIGEPNRIIDITVAIDKFEKIGKKGVYDELTAKGLNFVSISLLDPILELKGNNFEKLTSLKKILRNSEIGLKGIDDVETVLNYFNTLTINTELELDLTLARGLNYYTGAIFEVKSKDVEIGSICGGGRYDDLTGVFGLKDVSGVGVSFGADRIYDVMEQLNIFPKEIVSSTKVLFVNFGENEEKYCLPLLKILRDNGINSEIYPDSAKMNKQMTYANNKNIPFVVLVGESEMQNGLLTVKNMVSGEQVKMKFEELLQKLK